MSAPTSSTSDVMEPVPERYLWHYGAAESCPVCRTAMREHSVIDPAAALTQAQDYECPRCFIVFRAVSLFMDKLEAGDVADLDLGTDGRPTASGLMIVAMKRPVENIG